MDPDLGWAQDLDLLEQGLCDPLPRLGLGVDEQPREVG